MGCLGSVLDLPFSLRDCQSTLSARDSAMSTDYRALCAELVQAWDSTSDFDYNDFGNAAKPLVDRARAALAQPGPVGPTDLPPVQETAPERIWLHLNGANEWLPFKDEEGVVWSPDQIDESDIPYVRVDLARRGRPAITPIPVSEGLPGPEDCDAEGRCWLLTDCLSSTYWLPAHALPLPEGPIPPLQQDATDAGSLPHL
jgi:hypothetical protein